MTTHQIHAPMRFLHTAVSIRMSQNELKSWKKTWTRFLVRCVLLQYRFPSPHHPPSPSRTTIQQAIIPDSNTTVIHLSLSLSSPSTTFATFHVTWLQNNFRSIFIPPKLQHLILQLFINPINRLPNIKRISNQLQRSRYPTQNSNENCENNCDKSRNGFECWFDDWRFG